MKTKLRSIKLQHLILHMLQRCVVLFSYESPHDRPRSYTLCCFPGKKAPTFPCAFSVKSLHRAGSTAKSVPPCTLLCTQYPFPTGLCWTLCVVHVLVHTHHKYSCTYTMQCSTAVYCTVHCGIEYL